MGTSLNRLGEAVLTSTHNLCFSAEIWKISDFFFLSANFQFLMVKFSIYLNGSVFVMEIMFDLLSSHTPPPPRVLVCVTILNVSVFTYPWRFISIILGTHLPTFFFSINKINLYNQQSDIMKKYNFTFDLICLSCHYIYIDLCVVQCNNNP